MTVSAQLSQALLPALASSRAGEAAGFQGLQRFAAPSLLAVTQCFLSEARHVEDVIHDTLVMAWNNAHRQAASGLSPARWLCTLLASRLHNQLVALEGELPPSSPAEGFGPPSLSDQIPAQRCGPALWQLAQALPPVSPGEALSRRLTQRFHDVSRAPGLPLTPTGEAVHPPLYDQSLRGRMLTSRVAYQTKMAFQRTLGRPFEDYFFRRWQQRREACRMIEAQGLPRRSLETALGERLDIEIDPRRLVRGFSYPEAFPDRLERRKASNLFLWEGDWDQPRHYLMDSGHVRFIQDIWRHRLAPEESDTFQKLETNRLSGNPMRSHHRGMLLDSRERILEYLRLYLFYMEDMACFGFDAGAGKDRLGVAVDRRGQLIKINKGLHRLAMAQVLGLPQITVRVRSVHRAWWNDQTRDCGGREALERLAAALCRCAPAAE
ncbi:hypothetical protein [Halomonas mongoliensis]|uniref:hypothetical protein n=1 Tax=Halomonas mongoliensis TaxID=321265 RepID=UPI00403ACFB4